jgi:hypothetical protein
MVTKMMVALFWIALLGCLYSSFKVWRSAPLEAPWRV